MDQERERIHADLRGLLSGEVRCDDLFLQLYASDASIYEIKPLAVVRPRGVSDVVACLQYATENELPVHARGAGTGLAGESLGPGLVIDFSHAMRRIISIDEDTVRVQPGVVHAMLNRQLAGLGRTFGPDPATGSVSTMGSVLALDGSGSHWLQYGSARQHLRSVQVVLADGEVLELGQYGLDDESLRNVSTRERSLVRRLADLVTREEAVIRQHQPQTLVNRSGYQLHDILDSGQIDLARLMVGAEGTLALITEATLATDVLCRHSGVALLFFDRLESAAQGALLVAEMGATACDLMDRRLLSIARENDSRYDRVIPPQAEAMLLVECAGDQQADVRDKLQQIVVRLQRRKRLAFDARTALERDEIDLYWRLAQRVIPTLYRLKGEQRALPFMEDIAVPPQILPEFLLRLQNVLKNHQVTASLFAHAGHGQLHVRPFLDLANRDDVRRMQELASDVYEEVLGVGGTISGEHGDGLSRTWFVQRQYGPLYDVFREVKRIFDPQNILNPGKVVAEVPQPLTKNLRPVVAEPDETAVAGAQTRSSESDAGQQENNFEVFPLQLNWSSDSVEFAARSCNGCGRCRTELPNERMCPIYRFAPREEASPRAKANLMRAILTGRLSRDELIGDELKSLADLCVNCHQCRLECPAGVDIPKLMVEAKAQYVATNGLRPSDSNLMRLGRLSAMGSRFSRFANWSIGNPKMRWLLEKILGIAQGRKLPRFASRSFIRSSHRHRFSRMSRHSSRNVLYFVDTYANWHDIALAESVVAVLEHNGVTVFVPNRQQHSGMAPLSLGAIDRAKRVAKKNTALMVEAVRHGYQIVTAEPSAALCLVHEYPNLLEKDASLISENTSEACAYLWNLHEHGQLELDLKPINATVGYHQPCHSRALDASSPAEKLLRLIPGLKVERIEQGCSGMAGTFGLKRENYRSSLRAGWGLISALRDQKIQAGVTECSACKIQMEQGTTKPTVHPIKLLALSYGLKPELASVLTTRSEELIVT